MHQYGHPCTHGLSDLDCASTHYNNTDLEHSMGSRRGSIGVSRVLGPIPVPDLQHG